MRSAMTENERLARTRRRKSVTNDCRVGGGPTRRYAFSGIDSEASFARTPAS
jgi:hypothetical protein